MFSFEWCPPYCVANELLVRKCKPGLELLSAQTRSCLSQAFSPILPQQSWVGTEHFQLIMSFFVFVFFNVLLFILPFSSPKETESQLKIFHIIPF